MLALPHSWQVTLTIAKVSGRIFKRELDSAQSLSTSTSEASYSKANGTVLDRLQGIFQQDDDDFDEPDDAPPSRYRRRRDVLNAARLDDYIERASAPPRAVARILDKRDSADWYSYFRDRERNLNIRVSLPRPLSDFNIIEVGVKLLISHGRVDGCGDYLKLVTFSYKKIKWKTIHQKTSSKY